MFLGPVLAIGMPGGFELIIILVVVLLIFGGSKLPQLGEGLGKMLRGFRREMKAIEKDKDEEKSQAGEGEIDVTPATPKDS
ncbi:MAG: twin-arginine translocase TatA/TatE family subunit [Myxococcales bacterium]|nr:twin-arginine translocase TatA/TatE family subunit [Myxococcales bacterium]